MKAPSGGGSGRSQGGKTRVLTAKKRSNSSNRWLQRQLNDPYVKAAKAAGWRSRAAFKLIELDERFNLLRGVNRVVDLGAAPGGWCQVVMQDRPKATVVAIDLLPVEPITGVKIFQKDIRDDDAEAMILEALGGTADLVLSDMAANTVGHQQTDHIRTMGLIELGLDMATRLLRPGGSFVAKVLAGGGDNTLTAALKQAFATVKHVKPPASRKGSSEWYVVAQGFKGRVAEAVAPDPANALARDPANALARDPANALARDPANALARDPANALARDPANALARDPANALARDPE